MANPHPANPRSLFTPKSAEIPLADRPRTLDFVLPDHTKARVIEVESHDSINIFLRPADSGEKAQNDDEDGDHVAEWHREEGKGDKERTSLFGVVQEHRAVWEDIWTLSLSNESTAGGTADVEDLMRRIWIAVYGFWLRRDPYERLPIRVGGRDAGGNQLVSEFLVQTGLAFPAPEAKQAGNLLLVRAAFYQGAGAPRSLSWLRTPPSPFSELLQSSSYPHILSFTSRTSPPVLTTHPLRPAKPAPGSVVYARFIPSVGELLELTHIDASNPTHFDAYTRWQNSDRVNVGWREKGDAEHHKKYLSDSLSDPHKMGYLVTWNGQPAGYGECNWNQEDGMAAFVGGCGPYDQGTHLLVGEEKFRGRHRFASIMVSMKHLCFLREPRTDIVIGEPRFDLSIIPLLKTYLPQDMIKEVELPHKRAVYFVLRRERFFLEGQFY